MLRQRIGIRLRSVIISRVCPCHRPPARKLHVATTRYIASLVPSDGVWLQDPQAYHTTVFHASTHQHPVPAATAEVDAEAGAALRALRPLCPVFAVLDRVLATPGGAVLDCWHVVPGSTEPRHVREALRAALAKAPTQQARTKRGGGGGHCKSYDMGTGTEQGRLRVSILSKITSFPCRR